MRKCARKGVRRRAGVALALAGVAGALAAPAQAREVVLRAPYDTAVASGCADPTVDRVTGRFTYVGQTPTSCYGYATLASKNPLQSKPHRITATLHVERAYIVPHPLHYAGFWQAHAWLIIPYAPDTVGQMECKGGSVLTREEERSFTPVTVTDRTITVTCGPTGDVAYASGALRVYHQLASRVEIDATLESIVVRTI